MHCSKLVFLRLARPGMQWLTPIVRGVVRCAYSRVSIGPKKHVSPGAPDRPDITNDWLCTTDAE